MQNQYKWIAIVQLLLLAVHGLSPTDYRVFGLEKFGSIDEIYSGHMPLYLEDNTEGSFFFYMAKMRITQGSNKEKNKKLVIWLNGMKVISPVLIDFVKLYKGGPGCTSLLGAFFENGPLTLKGFGNNSKVYDIRPNPYSWNEVADVVFVEQPIRTGFSQASATAKKTRSERQIAIDFRAFLSSFLEIFSEFQDASIYITGESYAGFYIPWITEYILTEQKNERMEVTTASGKTRKLLRINLEGAAIGNGVMDYVIQTPSYQEYAYNHGLIPLEAKKRIDLAWEQCLAKAQYGNVKLNRGFFDDCQIMEMVLEASGHPNEYNTATFKNYDDVLSPDGPFNTFMNDPEIQTMLHTRGGGANKHEKQSLPGINFELEEGRGSVDASTGEYTPMKWVPCNDEINENMRKDHPVSAVPALQEVTKHIRVLLYNGEFDLNCNFLGTLHTLEDNLWEGRQWKEAKRSLYSFDGDGRGMHYKLGKLSFLVVKNSGHLLPMDQPAVALDMIRRFLNDESFDDLLLPKADAYEGKDFPSTETKIDTHIDGSDASGLSTVMSSISLVLLGVFFGILGNKYYPRLTNSHHQAYSSLP